MRPVIGSGKKDPSKEARDSKVLVDHNLISVSGGKLTTFDFMARRVMRRAKAWLQAPRRPTALPPRAGDGGEVPARLRGRFGTRAEALLAAGGEALSPIEGTRFTLAELRWSAEHEAVRHLDDLMLRRTRLGLLLPRGGAHLLSGLEDALRPALGWSPERWAAEVARYQQVWSRAYAPERIDHAPGDADAEPPATLAAAS